VQLEPLQTAMMAAIDLGPDQVPEGVFAGGRAAALRGLAVHANTISHARLVALEETFPRTRARLGAESFNRLSRGFVETGDCTREPLATIGRVFPAHIAPTHPEDATLARFEWFWLESYHAADADALDLATLARLDEDRLLALVLVRHPAARIATAPGAAQGDWPDLRDGELALIARPDCEVRVSPASQAMGMLLEMLDEPCLVADLLEPGDTLPALVALIEAGAVCLHTQEEGED
jgi:hypothetical protein